MESFSLSSAILVLAVAEVQPSPSSPVSALSLNNVLPVLEAKKKYLSKREIPEQSCGSLGDLFTFLEDFRDTHKNK